MCGSGWCGGSGVWVWVMLPPGDVNNVRVPNLGTLGKLLNRKWDCLDKKDILVYLVRKIHWSCKSDEGYQIRLTDLNLTNQGSAVSCLCNYDNDCLT